MDIFEGFYKKINVNNKILTVFNPFELLEKFNEGQVIIPSNSYNHKNQKESYFEKKVMLPPNHIDKNISSCDFYDGKFKVVFKNDKNTF